MNSYHYESFWIELLIIESDWIKLDLFESHWIVLNHIESFWIIFNHIESLFDVESIAVLKLPAFEVLALNYS